MKTLKNKKIKLPRLLSKIALPIILLMTVSVFSAVPAYALDISGPIKRAFNEQVLPNIKGIAGVIFSAISVILLVFLIVRIVLIYKAFQNHEDVEWWKLILLAMGLCLSATATTWMWGIIG